jgi:hypothetical protein
MKKYFKLKHFIFIVLANLCFVYSNAQTKKTSDMNLAELTRKMQEKKDNHDRVTRGLRKPNENNRTQQPGNSGPNENMPARRPAGQQVTNKQ